jgi:hypothetical protein
MKELNRKLTTVMSLSFSLALMGGCAPESEPGVDTGTQELEGYVGTTEQAVDWCTCVNYMFRRFPAWGNYGPESAKNYGPWLVQYHGYQSAGQTPQLGDVVIMQPGFSGAQVDATHGHIAVVSAIGWNGTKRRIYYTGANQPGTQFTELNCSNVTHTSTSEYNVSDTRIAFYRK